MEIADFKGKTFTRIEVRDDEIIFHEGFERWRMFHEEECCESVEVEDVCGDIKDLLNTPIVQAFEKTSDENPTGISKESQDDSFTWTFYTLSTIKGTVTIRWYGESNGYYSEEVSIKKIII